MDKKAKPVKNEKPVPDVPSGDLKSEHTDASSEDTVTKVLKKTGPVSPEGGSPRSKKSSFPGSEEDEYADVRSGDDDESLSPGQNADEMPAHKKTPGRKIEQASLPPLNQTLEKKTIYLSEEGELRKRGYEVFDKKLGEGTYAKVRKAKALQENNKLVAVKIINRRKAAKDYVTKFLPRELEVMLYVKNHKVIETYEVFTIGYKTYIICEYCGRGDLLEYVRLRGHLTESTSRKMFAQIFEGLAYMHKHGISHRDMKCENILIANDNTLKIADFSFARQYKFGDLSSTFCGSTAYASPEVLKGVQYVMAWADIWSTGVILFIMVNGTMPFDDSHVRKMIKDQELKAFKFSGKLDSQLTKDVKDLIKRILEPDLKKRYTFQQIMHHDWMKAAEYDKKDDMKFEDDKIFKKKQH